MFVLTLKLSNQVGVVSEFWLQHRAYFLTRFNKQQLNMDTKQENIVVSFSKNQP